MALSCRLCRTPVLALGGCAMCADFKKNLVSDSEDEEEQPSLAQVSNESVLAVRALIKKARELIKDADSNSKSFAKGAQLALTASGAMAKVLDTARKLQEDGISVIKNMSFVEKLELFAGWYMELPPSYRMKLMEHLQNEERQLAEKTSE